MELMNGIRLITDEKKLVSGFSTVFGNARESEMHIYGNLQEVVKNGSSFTDCIRPVKEDSVYDLASVTKFFTSVSVMLLLQSEKLKLTDPVSRYDKRFSGLLDMTIYDLLAFQKAVSSPDRIDTQPTRELALKQLFSVVPSPRPAIRYYTDMGAMILKYVVEGASGKAHFDFIKENILDPLGMKHTYATLPESEYENTACYNYERRILPDGSFFVDEECPVGTIHDPKARIISPDGKDMCGHAGLYSTLSDMKLLGQGMLNNAILSRELLLEMGKNHTGYPLPDGGYTQYLGYLCYAKHPVQTFSEVPEAFADGSVALNGFTGNHFSIDPYHNWFIVQLSNRIHNRITVATGRPDPNMKHLETMAWNDGKSYPVSQNYVYYKDENLKNPTCRILMEKY